MEHSQDLHEIKVSKKWLHLGLTAMWLVQTLVSFLAQAIVAAYFGASASLDAYLVGTAIPTTIYMIVSTGLGATAIVHFNQAKARGGESEAREKIGGLTVGISTVSVVAAILIFLAADGLIGLIAPGLRNEVRQQAVACLRISAPSLPFVILFCLLSGLLQAEGRFYATSIGSILFVGLVPLPVLVGKEVSPEALAWGFDLSAGTGCLVLFVLGAFRHSVKMRMLSRVEWKHVITFSMPAFAAACFTHGIWLLERYFASSLAPGGISALNYGQRIVNFVAGGLTFATSTTLLSYLSDWLESGNTARAGAFNRRIIGLTTRSAIAGMLGLLLGGEWLVRLAFARGQFDESAVELTTTVVHLYLGVFVAYLFSVVLGRNALAVNEGKVMVASTGALFVSYLIVAPVLQRILSLQGLALAASLAWLLSLSVYLFGMCRKYPYLYWQVTSTDTNQSVSKRMS